VDRSEPCVNWRGSVAWRAAGSKPATLAHCRGTQRDPAERSTIARPRSCPVDQTRSPSSSFRSVATANWRTPAAPPMPNSSARHYTPTRGPRRSELHGRHRIFRRWLSSPSRRGWLGDEGVPFSGLGQRPIDGFTDCQASLPSSSLGNCLGAENLFLLRIGALHSTKKIINRVPG
jgi:hypothetical protein